MRFFRIFLLHFQGIFEQRSRAFVWFLFAIFNPLLIILFWKTATMGGKVIGRGWDFSSLVAYYFYFMIVITLVMPRVERDVAEQDIYRGNLTSYLLRPYSYFWKKFLEDIPNRVLQACYAVILCILFFFLFGKEFFVFSLSVNLLFACISLILGFFLAFTFKMILGLCAFWVVETDSLFETMEILTIIFCGNIMPIVLMPMPLKTIANFLPFPSMVYFPIVVFLGKLPINDMLMGIFTQCLWLGIFIFLYRLIWHQGIKKFTGDV